MYCSSGDHLAIAKETGRRLGMGTNMYPSSSLLGHSKDSIVGLPIDELIEKADGFAGVFPGILDLFPPHIEPLWFLSIPYYVCFLVSLVLQFL